jgi:hypothetical protein
VAFGLSKAQNRIVSISVSRGLSIKRLLSALSAGPLLLYGLSDAAGAKLDSDTRAQIDVCHGYSCKFRSKLMLGKADARRLESILASGRRSPQAERRAISRAVRYFEDRAYSIIGIRDEPQSKFGASGIRGQMDCIDESTNTRALLLYLANRKSLMHHSVGRNTSRGLLVDGRYFHSTAVIRDRAGVKWAVDSWYAPMGGAPDILPLSEWEPRGFLSSGALD